MDIKTYDTPREHMLTAQMSMTSHEIHNLQARASAVITETLIEKITLELMPQVFDYVQRTIDWQRITTEVENSIIRRMTNVITPETRTADGCTCGTGRQCPLHTSMGPGD